MGLCKFLQLPYANEALVSDHLVLTFWVVAYVRFDCISILNHPCFFLIYFFFFGVFLTYSLTY